MIYTVTLNPALDYIVSVDDFQMGMTNRIQSEKLLPGGKGLNVSILLHNLGLPSIALGFVAGFIGDEIRRRFEALGGSQQFIRLPEGCSRINVKMQSADGTEINGKGPFINEICLEQLKSQLDSLKEGDVLILSGNVPSSVPADIYRDLLERMEGRDVLAVVDTTREYLMELLEKRPFLIKPNMQELGEIFETEICEWKQAVVYATRLQRMGARNVLVSMGGQGAVLLDETGAVHRAEVPPGTLVNSIGAGDSMVAGFIIRWLEKKNYSEAFRMAVAAGSASAFSENLAKKDEVLKLYEQIKERQEGTA